MTGIKLGIDEAGKGPVIGPMCIAGVCLDAEQEKKLKILGVNDSKKMAPKKRTFFDATIKKYATAWYVHEIDAKQIDDMRKIMTMNEIAVLCFSKVMEEMTAAIDLKDDIEMFTIAYLDAADIFEDRFGRRVKTEYSKKYADKAAEIEFISKHKADVNNPIVSSASIIAKHRRDSLIEEIKKEEGVDFGSGYPSDPYTRRFLEKYAKEHGEFPDYVRKSWKTAEDALSL
ncbi:MAG: ribonuclease HII [Methanimicrococcus sp.]|nr:ribonuclease HII [Methanimicrococcus sp.]